MFELLFNPGFVILVCFMYAAVMMLAALWGRRA